MELVVARQNKTSTRESLSIIVGQEQGRINRKYQASMGSRTVALILRCGHKPATLMQLKR